MPNRKTQRRLIYAVFACVYVMCTAYAISYFFQNSSLGDQYPRTRFDAMVDGYAAKPFIYRQLVPLLIRSVDVITPPAFRDDVNEGMERFRFRQDLFWIQRYMPWLNPTFPLKVTHYKRLVGSIFIIGFWIGYMAGLYYLAKELFPSQPAIALFAPIFGTLAFTSFGYQWQYIYDIPCLCLSTACFYFIYKQRFRMYLLIFLMASLNKETAIFSLVFFTVWHWNRLETKKFAILWALQCAIYLSVKISVSIYFMNNSGFFLEQNMPIVLARDVLGESNLYKMAVFAVMWLMFTYQWQEKPEFLKRTLVVLPLLYLAYFLYGYPHEYRVFFDMHGPLILLLTHTLIAGTGIGSVTLFQSTITRPEGGYVADA